MQITFGIIGLGKMGYSLALQAAEKDFFVVGFDKFSKKVSDHPHLSIEDSVERLIARLPSPRIVFLYIPAGAAVDQELENLSTLLSSQDIVVDAGNSYWGDSIRRAERLLRKGIHLIDCGTSGGVSGARNGACFMVGGAPEAIEQVRPILEKLAVPNGFTQTGPSGSGHFVKLVHNGIEFGMLQAIGEGMQLLRHYKDPLQLPEILRCWNHGSVIRSWLVELMEQQLREKGGFDEVPAYVEDTGEVNWLVGDALNMEVPIPVIGASVMQLFASRDKAPIWSKAIALMRHGFGGHPFGGDATIQHERKFGRVGDLYREKE